MTDNFLYIVKEETALLPIIIPENYSEVEEHSAEELRSYILKATGVALSIEEEKEEKCGIYIGYTKFADKHGISGDSEENWIIAEKDGSLIITGGLTSGDRGVFYAVTHFLEDVVGIRWWNHAEEYVPSLCEIKVEKDYVNKGTPAFRYRKTVDAYAYTDFYYSARSKVNAVGSGDNVVDKAYNSSVRKTGGALWASKPGHVHTIELYFPKDEYFKTNPEWWGWDEAEQRRQKDRQICFSNESFYEAMREKLFKYIKEEFSSAEKCGINKPHFFSVSVSDDRLHCQCPECIASVEKSGRSGHYLKFVNRLAREAREKYPEAVIETLAYWDYIEVPKDDTVPESNVIIRFAHLLTDVSHGINHPLNSEKLRMLKEWAELCKKSGASLYSWEYNLYLFPHYPLPMMYLIPETYRTLYEIGLTGCFVENELSFVQGFWTLNQWLLTKYMENPYLDFDDLMEDFLTKFYGKAAEYIREYLDKAYVLMENSPMYILLDQNSSNWNYITPEFVCDGVKLFDKALNAVKGDRILEQRVREASIDLYRAAAIQHEALKREMELKNLDLELPSVRESADKAIEAAKELKDKYAFYINRTSVHFDNGFICRIDEQCDMLEKIKNDTYNDFEVPEIIKGTKKDDIFNIPAYKIVRFLKNQNKVTTEEDKDADSPFVFKYKGWVLGLNDNLADKNAWSFSFVLTHNTKIREELVIKKTDLDGGEYKWFKIGDVSFIDDNSDTTLYVNESNGLTVKLQPIHRIFPFDKCDIYVRIKGEGHSFENNDNDDRICIDRFMVVR